VLRNDRDGDASLGQRAGRCKTDETAAEDEDVGAQIICLF
jgi:hypothetical protein